MTKDDYSEERYSVCIAHELQYLDQYSNQCSKVRFYRVADYLPDDASEGDELSPAFSPSYSEDWEGWCKDPSFIHCWAAYEDFFYRDSDIYLLEWRIDPDYPNKQLSRICDGRDGLPTSDDVREVIDIPGVNSRKDLLKVLSEGYQLNGLTTREFYLVYEHPAGGYQRYAIKCRRDDFVSRDGKLRLLFSAMNVRQTVLSAPIVVLSEKKIIQTSDFPDLGGREIYTGLGSLDEDEGSLLLRSLAYFASDYVKYYLEHCETNTKLTDKERRYAVARAIEEALSRPDKIEEYIGAEDVEYSEDELEELKAAIAAQMREKDDAALNMVQNVLMEDEDIRMRCLDLVRNEYKESFAQEQNRLAKVRSEANAAEELCSKRGEEAEELDKRIASLREEIAEAKERRASMAAEEERALREIEDNVALKLGLKSVAKSLPVSGSAGPSKTLVVEPGALLDCIEAKGDLVETLIGNLKKLGVEGGKQALTSASVGIAGCLTTCLPMAVPEPMAMPAAEALAAALYSSAPTRVVVPPDYRDVEAVVETLNEPGVYIVEGAIDSVNEGIIFPLLRRWECSTVIFAYRSHASASLLAKETWASMFMPSVETLSWAPFFASGKALETLEHQKNAKMPSGKDVMDEVENLSALLPNLKLPLSALILPAAIELIAEDEWEVEESELVVAQHLVMAAGANPEVLGVVFNWA